MQGALGARVATSDKYPSANDSVERFEFFTNAVSLVRPKHLFSGFSVSRPPSRNTVR